MKNTLAIFITLVLFFPGFVWSENATKQKPPKPALQENKTKPTQKLSVKTPAARIPVQRPRPKTTPTKTASKRTTQKPAPAAKARKAAPGRKNGFPKNKNRGHGAIDFDAVESTPVVLQMDTSDIGAQPLTEEDVEKVIQSQTHTIMPCLVDYRRRDPEARSVRLQLIIHSLKGVILKGRVDGEERSRIAQCMMQKLKDVKFPRRKTRPITASVSLILPR